MHSCLCSQLVFVHSPGGAGIDSCSLIKYVAVLHDLIYFPVPGPDPEPSWLPEQASSGTSRALSNS